MNGLSLYRADFPNFPEGPFGLVASFCGAAILKRARSLEGQSRRFAFAGRMSVLTPIATEMAICAHVG
jgi:hypothetical protein